MAEERAAIVAWQLLAPGASIERFKGQLEQQTHPERNCAVHLIADAIRGAAEGYYSGRPRNRTRYRLTRILLGNPCASVASVEIRVPIRAALAVTACSQRFLTSPSRQA